MRNAALGVRFLAVVTVLMGVGGGFAWAALDGVNGRFVATCQPSHTNNDDPIVYPRRPGWSHSHQYFGARSTNAFSRPSQLRRGITTCNRAEDTGAYWVPTLRVRQETIEPIGAWVYYAAGRKSREVIRPFPPGLRMIAGDSGATHQQPEHKVTWYCILPPIVLGAHRKVAKAHPYCPQQGGILATYIRFPDCWDGRHRDSPNHKAHMRYSRQRKWTLRPTCPESHPVSVPGINLEVVYPTAGDPDPRKIELSSGGIHSLHADFINSWDQGELERLVRTCINLSAC